MLTLENLRLTHGDWTLEADLNLAAGARCALIGPSGAGKSTLLGAIAGFMAPTRGRILWQAQDLAQLAPGERPVSILFQDNNLFPHLTAAQNIGLGLRPNLRLSTAEKARVAEALGRVGLADYADRKPAALSGGQQGRVALARALLRARPLLLLDEPFAALGPALRAEMLDLVASICSETGATLLMVSHDPGDARRIADQTIVIGDGRAAPPQKTEALFADPPPALRRYLGTN
ncbi:thiamine import ATP-binding protein ThiQ [Allgaiera indica]|uniref:Thiamine import ATP-binding protein ThiQ n=1 Tax=Allgaiera indica TaxID=765699 RepID=A0AAN4UN43_9RHOB|nr:thiamine ABC transporter ATP-binding protein [Allgaiera indica]GHD98681.1 thiamine import ATP-binding protein ThiQ [Allgaiera indica]SDW08501.1 thiamine transport system ATP-binding protein [Allgaiera indica]